MRGNAINSTAVPSWMVAVALIFSLYLMYGSSFTTDYLMNDEQSFVGERVDPIQQAKERLFFNGRPIAGFLQALSYNYAGFDTVRIQSVRFLNFAMLAGLATLLFFFLDRQLNHTVLSAFAILFLFSQPAFWGLMGYSLQLISEVQPSIGFSLGAFYVFFYAFKNRNKRRLTKIGATFGLFLAASLSAQTYAYFAMVPLTLIVLNEWEDRKKEVLQFLFIAFLSLVVSLGIYWTTLDYLHSAGDRSYQIGENLRSAISLDTADMILAAINPLRYWSAFTMWSYPFPFHYTLILGKWKEYLALGVMLIWASVILKAILLEIQSGPVLRRKNVVYKWLTVILSLGFGALIMIADSPTATIQHRPHLTLTFVGVVIFSAAYAIKVITSGDPPVLKRPEKLCMALIVMFTAVGAQAGFSRGIVDVRADRLDFIRTELSAKPISEYSRIVVVLPDHYYDYICVTEPCGQWLGNQSEAGFHATLVGKYRYALATMGANPDAKKIHFRAEPYGPPSANEVVVDWRKYIAARDNHFQYLVQRK